MKVTQLTKLTIVHITPFQQYQILVDSKFEKLQMLYFLPRTVMDYKTHNPIKYLGMFCLNGLSNLWGNVTNLHSKIPTLGYTYFWIFYNSHKRILARYEKKNTDFYYYEGCSILSQKLGFIMLLKQEIDSSLIASLHCVIQGENTLKFWTYTVKTVINIHHNQFLELLKKIKEYI